jgi:hypothetical protein
MVGWARSPHPRRSVNDCPRGLKSIPPLSARRQQREIEGKKIEVIYPPSIISEKSVSKVLKKLATERNALHRKRLMWSIVGMPIMAPFGLIPLIPNLPFFYLIYRGESPTVVVMGLELTNNISIFALERYNLPYHRHWHEF